MSKLGIDIGDNTAPAQQQPEGKVVSFPYNTQQEVQAEQADYQYNEEGKIVTKDLSNEDLVKAHLEAKADVDSDGQMRLSQMLVAIENKTDKSLKDVYYLAVGENKTLEQVLTDLKYGDFDSKTDFETYYRNMESKLIHAGHDFDMINEVMNEVKNNPDHVKASYNDMLGMLDAKITEQEYSDRLKQRQLERKKQEEEKEAAEDYTYSIKNILSERKIHNVHPRELIDVLWQDLSPEMKEYYHQNPSYAAYKCANTPQFEKALTTCLDKFNKSVAIEKVINEYLEEHCPDRESNTLEIEKLAASCPEAIRTGDMRVDAYLVIDAMRSTNGDELTEEDLKNNPEVLNEIEAKLGANIDSDEPLSVAASEACDPGILENLSNNVGRKITKSAKTCDNIISSLKLKGNKTVKQNLQERRAEDPSKQQLYEQLLKEKDRERQELERQLKEKEERIRQMDEEQRRIYAQNNRYDYGYVNNRYNNNNIGYAASYQQQPQQQRGLINKQNLSMKHFALILNAILLLFCILLTKITKRSTMFSIIGLGIASFGILSAGKHKDSTRMTIGGYAITILGIALICF